MRKSKKCALLRYLYVGYLHSDRQIRQSYLKSSRIISMYYVREDLFGGYVALYNIITHDRVCVNYNI